ncbi:MAG: serine protease [Verrucomicrobiales bacterium]|nr:serine protease [Verrucomicrobiales bacterium]
MTTDRLLSSLIAASFGCVLAFPVGAQDLATKGREVFNKHQSSVVTVLLVVKTKMAVPGLAGLGGDARESKEEVTGTVIDESGLTAVALSSTDPTGMLQGMMGSLGDLGGDGEESFKFKMDSEVTDVKLLTGDGTELPAEIVLRDKDLDLAFVRPKSKPATPMPALDLANSAKVDVLDEIIAINRLGKATGRAYAAAIERISAVVKRPRLFYVPGGGATMTGLGSPAFTPDGKLVGLFVMRTVKSGGGGMSLFSMPAGMTPMILPAEDVKKIAAQVPAMKEEAK